MRISTVLLPVGLLVSLPSALGVLLQITEVRFLNGSEPRTEIVDIPYIDDSVLPKDQPCPALPFLTREVTLLVEDLTVPTRCWLYSQLCHESLTYVSNDKPEVNLTMGPTFAARCFEEE